MPKASVSVIGEFFLVCLADTIFCVLEEVSCGNPQSDEPVVALSILGLLLPRPPQSSIKP